MPTAAFDTLYRPALRSAAPLARRLTNSREDAEDLLQEASIRAWRHFRQFDSARSFTNWFLAILKHRAADAPRKRNARLCLLSLDSLMEDSGDVLPASDADPLRAVLANEHCAEMLSALFSLPSIYAWAVLLADVEGRTYKEISALTGVAVGTVRSRLHRGRRLLKAKRTA